MTILDLAVSASAGAAAAAAASHLNGDGVVPLALRMGALGGTIKAALVGFVSLVAILMQHLKDHWICFLPVVLVGSRFSIAIVVTTATSSIILDEGELLMRRVDAGRNGC